MHLADKSSKRVHVGLQSGHECAAWTEFSVDRSSLLTHGNVCVWKRSGNKAGIPAIRDTAAPKSARNMHHYHSYCTVVMMVLIIANSTSCSTDSLLSHNRFLGSHDTFFRVSHLTRWENHPKEQSDWFYISAKQRIIIYFILIKLWLIHCLYWNSSTVKREYTQDGTSIYLSQGTMCAPTCPHSQLGVNFSLAKQVCFLKGNPN